MLKEDQNRRVMVWLESAIVLVFIIGAALRGTGEMSGGFG